MRSDIAVVINSSRNTQRTENPDVENPGVEEDGIVGVNTRRFANNVDSERCVWILRVARCIEDAERKAKDGSTSSADSREAFIYPIHQSKNTKQNLFWYLTW